MLCRNLAFTYHAREGQRMVLAHLAHALSTGGALVIGAHESLRRWRRELPIVAGRPLRLSEERSSRDGA